MGPIWIVEKYDQISTRIAKRWRQVLGKHGARFHPHFVPGKTRVVILPSKLSRATVNKLLPCDCRDVRLLTQEWAVEAIKRAIALGEAKTKEGGGEGGKEGGKEGGGLRPPPYAQYLFVDPADLTAHRAAAEEEQEQARGGGREGKDKGRKRLRGAVGRWGCMEASSDGIVNLNKHLTPLFEELAAIYEMLGNEAAQGPFRKRQYGRLVPLLKSLPFKVDEDNVKQLQKIKGVGKSIAKDIQEILTRGRLSRLEALKMTQGVGARLSFQKIWGVGPVTARALYEHDGIGSIAELRARVVTHPGILNENQRIGLKYYEELQQRIPRAEASEIERRVRQTAESLDPRGFTMTTCGSYRRGASHCGDVDILFAPTEGRESVGDLIWRVVRRLEEEGFLTDHLTSTRHDSVHDFSESYFGICCLGQGYPHRRLDLKTYPREQYPFAVLYFTGSDYFNRSMRCWAINHKGWSLTDKSMGPALWKHGRKVRDVGDRVICHDERGIFKALGLAYKHPWERNTHDAVMLVCALSPSLPPFQFPILPPRSSFLLLLSLPYV